ncbi:hypothetical protein ACLMJK_008628 [Lecanora helva]
MSVYATTQAPGSKPTMTKSASATDGQNLRAPASHRHRKSVSTGGGRAWSDAEEAYLIETREHKMPYKHIASQLKKTELACRLHYHQLSFGSKSRRQPSMSPYERQSIPPEEERVEALAPQKHLPSFSPPSSPPDTMEYYSMDPSKAPQSHKPILPKPVPSNHRRGQGTKPLRLVTEDVDHYQEKAQYVDIARLDRIYDEHRLHFWSTIARSYGCNLSPAALEEAWYRAHGMSGSRFPPTPRGSPSAASTAVSSATPYSAMSAIDTSKGFTPVNPTDYFTPKQTSTRNNSFSVSSLLTEDKEVRLSPSREKKLEDVEMS